jgi:hypothetical protein
MINGGRCAECGTRTRYRDAALFEEYARYDDVCFDPDRFRERLKERIADAVRRARKEYGDSAEIRRIVLNADTAGFFDEYTDRMETGGVSYGIDTDGDLLPANSDGYESYSFGAWYTPPVYERVVVHPRYYIDREGIGRRKADKAAGIPEGERDAAARQ